MGLALYRKYRSRSLDDIVGQAHVTELLKRAIEADKVAHAYLFTGPKGVGKTSIARIVAHAINELPYEDDSTHLDIIEIDAASNNGVEDIRELRERVQTAPSSAKKKVYIIDEVHMLSKPAFNALLKTLEEPPEHVVFILATTDIDKVPETILSRTQRHSFRRASVADIVKNLQRIAKEESIQVDDAALELIAVHADGSFRDSVSLFDQISSGQLTDKTITEADVQRSLGLAASNAITALLDATISGDASKISAQLAELEASGTPIRIITLQLMQLVRDRIPVHPELARLLERLLDVEKSVRPELKLLTALALYTNTPQPTSNKRLDTPVVASPSSSQPAKKTNPSVNKSEAATKKSAAPTKKPDTKPVVVADFDWQALLDYVRTNHVALHSVLSKCEPELSGETLTLFTRTNFYKKKLDDGKYRSLLSASLQECGMGDLTIETVAATKPPKDSRTAEIVAMMGGGEEVSVDDAE